MKAERYRHPMGPQLVVLESDHEALEASITKAKALLAECLNADRYDWNMGLRDRVQEFIDNN